jgi:DNA-binding NarL/FixJ family response regulator
MNDDLLTDPVSYMVRAMLRHDVDESIVRRIATDTRKLFGGSQVYIKALDREARDREIRRLMELGASPAAIARTVKTSVATVRRRRSLWL